MYYCKILYLFNTGMVLYFTSDVVSPPAIIYMGKDKFENELLIKYGWDEDIWFHVDDLSSAHVYLRLPTGRSWEQVESALLIDCAQLVKANSIKGNKLNHIEIKYTPWSNLRKSADMDVGQIGFHDNRKVKSITIEKRDNAIINRLDKTRVEKSLNLAEEKEIHLMQLNKERKALFQEQRLKQKKEEEEKQKAKLEKSYDFIMDSTPKQYNEFNGKSMHNLEDDFM